MISNALIAAVGILFVTAITPGPNNLVVLRMAASGGFSAAWPAIGGIVLGGVVMLALAVVGLGTAPLDWSVLRSIVAIGGSAYLGWLGIGLVRQRARDSDRPALPVGLVGLFGFQFLNPKSWAMVLSLVAAFPQVGMPTTFAYLVPVFVLVPTACLLLWTFAGVRLANYLRNPTTRRWVDRTLGVALLVSAILLMF